MYHHDEETFDLFNKVTRYSMKIVIFIISGIIIFLFPQFLISYLASVVNAPTFIRNLRIIIFIYAFASGCVFLFSKDSDNNTVVQWSILLSISFLIALIVSTSFKSGIIFIISLVLAIPISGMFLAIFALLFQLSHVFLEKLNKM